MPCGERDQQIWEMTGHAEAHKYLGFGVMGPDLGCFQEISYKEVF